jgi:hypothetical protein
MCGFVGTHGCFMRLVTAGHTNKTYTPLLRKVLCVFSTAQTSAAIISSKCLVLCDTCTELVRQASPDEIRLQIARAPNLMGATRVPRTGAPGR